MLRMTQSLHEPQYDLPARKAAAKHPWPVRPVRRCFICNPRIPATAPAEFSIQFCQMTQQSCLDVFTLQRLEVDQEWNHLCGICSAAWKWYSTATPNLPETSAWVAPSWRVLTALALSKRGIITWRQSTITVLFPQFYYQGMSTAHEHMANVMRVLLL